VSTDSYDAVVLGGGHNGLVAAAYLARAGRTVLLLERRDGLGGAAVSGQLFPSVGARISRYSYLVSLLPRLIVDELGLDVRLARRRVSSYTPDPRAGCVRGLLVDSGDVEATRASFAAITGSQRAWPRWLELSSLLARAARRLFPTLVEPLRSRAHLRALLDDEQAWEILFERPIAETLSERLQDDLLVGLAWTDALIGMFAPAEDPGLRQNRCFLYHVIGGGTGEWRVPVGGMGRLAGELERAARTAGARLLTGARAVRVEPARDGADVVYEHAGETRRVRAGHLLVNAAPAVLEALLGNAPAGEGEAPEGSQLKLNMLLARLPRLCAPGLEAERAFAGTFHVNEGAGQLRRAFEQARSGAIPEPAPCELYCHSLTDPSVLEPSLRATGAHTLTAFALHMPARLFRADPQGTRAAAQRALLRSLDGVLAEPIADCLLRDPAGEPCIEAHSPLDIEAELAMPGGHIFHRDLRWPFAEDEREVGRWGVETEHPRVLLCGAGARRGGGVSGIPGRNAAMAVLGRGAR
jgi:phytoene dehydrogenase-like protein